MSEVEQPNLNHASPERPPLFGAPLVGVTAWWFGGMSVLEAVVVGVSGSGRIASAWLMWAVLDYDG